MKYTFLLAVILAALTSSAQVKIVELTNPSVAINGTEIIVNGDPTDFYIKAELLFINISGEDNKFNVARRRIVEVSLIDVLLDNVYSYDATDIDYFVTPLALTVNDEDTSLLEGWIKNVDNMTYCAIHRYYVLDSLNVPVDSVDVKFLVGGEDCFLGIQDENSTELKIYPNPANKILNIKFDNSSESYDFRISDMVGNLVLDEKLMNSSQINIQHLPSGVYLYCLSQQGVVLETKKLVINR